MHCIFPRFYAFKVFHLQRLKEEDTAFRIREQAVYQTR